MRRYENEAAADQVLKGSAFAYAGGYGSVVDLAKRGGLAAVWPHCNMVSVGRGEFKPYAEPFSLVVRAESTGLLAALDGYIHNNQYEGTANPSEVKCLDPPWAPK